MREVVGVAATGSWRCFDATRGPGPGGAGIMFLCVEGKPDAKIPLCLDADLDRFWPPETFWPMDTY